MTHKTDTLTRGRTVAAGGNCFFSSGPIALAVLGIRALADDRPGYGWMLLAVTTTLAAAVTTDAWSFTPVRTPVIIAMAPWLFVVTLVLSRPRAAALNI